MMRPMHKTIKTAATALLAAAAITAYAQPAAADDPAARVTTIRAANSVTQVCTTPQRDGVLGGVGNWGRYVDGCTVRLTCPSHLSTCKSDSTSTIRTQNFVGHRVSLNTRIRALLSSGTQIFRRDKSCAGTNECQAKDLLFVRGGQHVSIQCNGVRQIATGNSAAVTCALELTYQ
jgi:hypothetical protein